MALKKNEMIVAVSADDNFVIQLKVMLYSLLQSRDNNTAIHFKVLCDETLCGANRDMLRQFIDRQPAADIDFITIDTVGIHNAGTHAEITISSYYRLFLPTVLSDSRCLYLDADLIVLSDLNWLYDTAFEGAYLCGVRDCDVSLGRYDGLHKDTELNIPSIDDYVNAGVLLLNLDELRENGLPEVFRDAIGDGYRFMDQDILNKFCYGKITHIPLCYNLFAELYRNKTLFATSSFPREWENHINNPSIIHYPGRFKPWLFPELYASMRWWEFADRVLSAEEQSILNGMRISYRSMCGADYIDDKLKKEERAVVFGFSELTKQWVSHLNKENADKIIAFADNDKEKQGMFWNGKEITDMDHARKCNEDGLWIISSQNSHAAIRKMLVGRGVPGDRIVRYIHLGEEYDERMSFTNAKESTLIS